MIVTGNIAVNLLLVICVGIFITAAGIICLVFLVSGIRQKGKKSNKKMICPNCGYETRPDFIVCPKCGKKLDGSETSNIPRDDGDTKNSENKEISEEKNNSDNSENKERNDA